MNKLNTALVAVIACFAVEASAATYTYDALFSAQTSYTGNNSWATSTNRDTVATNNFGNTRTFSATGSSGSAPLSVTVSAWANTATGSTIESAYLARYGNNTELGVTSLETSSNDEYTYTRNGSYQYNPNTNNNQHAMDNVGALESMLLDFSSAVNLTGFTNGWPSGSGSLDTDISMLVWTGAGLSSGTTFSASSHLVGKTYTDLLTLGWQTVGSFGDNDTSFTNNDLSGAVLANTPVPVSTALSSRFWLIGAEGLSGTKLDTKHNSDYAKLKAVSASITTTPPSSTGIPEPTSIALIGGALAGMVFTRRRKQS